MILVRFSQSRAHLEEPNEDVRGLTVKDAKGQDVGTVTDLFYDLDSKTVRFLEVGSGGFLGLGEKHFIVSAPDVKRINSTIKLDMTRDQIMRQPEGETIHPMEAAPVRVKTGEMRREMGPTEKPMGTTEKPMATTEKPMGPSERFGVMPEVGTAREKGRTYTGTAPAMKEPTHAEKEQMHKAPTPMKKEHVQREITPMEKEHVHKATMGKEPMLEAGMKGMTREQMSSLVGKTVQREVRAKDGTVIAVKGDKITEKDIHKAEQHNAIDLLMNAVAMKH